MPGSCCRSSRRAGTNRGTTRRPAGAPAVISHLPMLSAAVSKCGEGSGCSDPQGGLNLRGLGSCYRPCPHAQIFFPSAKPLIIFFESKKSNGGALSSAQQYKPSQALRRRVLGRRRRAGWKSGIYFGSQFVRPRGAVKSSVDPGSRTAWLIPTRNLEIKYRKPTLGRHRPRGGLNPAGLVGPGPWPSRTHFREIRIYFFIRTQALAGLDHAQKSPRNSGWGGSVARHDEEIDA
jgi:hypothetical protein